MPYVPLEKEIDQLVGVFAHSKYGALLQLMKETGFRPIEALQYEQKVALALFLVPQCPQ